MSTTEKRPLYIPYVGPTLLEMPLLNKCSAFTHRERVDFILRSATKEKVKVIVVTDGERILRLGDQGFDDDTIRQTIERNFWRPSYWRYLRRSI